MPSIVVRMPGVDTLPPAPGMPPRGPHVTGPGRRSSRVGVQESIIETTRALPGDSFQRPLFDCQGARERMARRRRKDIVTKHVFSYKCALMS